MGVRAPDGRRAPIQIIAHGELFARGIRVNLRQGDIVSALRLAEDLVRAQKRVVRPVVHVAPADQVHHEQAQALRPVVNAPALPRALRRKVGRAQHVRVLVQIGRDLLLGKRVVAQRNYVRTRGKDVIRLLGGDAATGGVFPVDNDEIRAVVALDAAQQAVQGVNPRLANHIAYGQNFHGFTSCLFCAASGRHFDSDTAKGDGKAASPSFRAACACVFSMCQVPIAPLPGTQSNSVDTEVSS